MASSLNNNTASFETWEFLSTFDNSWFSEADAEVITKALTHSLTNGSDDKNFSFPATPTPLPLLSVSSSGASDPDLETPSVSKRPPRNPVAGKIAKRKSRASKRTPTTFITADPENFRQMVQQVTGVGFVSGTGSILKPEPHRAVFGPGLVARLQGAANGNGGYLLPTLDTSAFLLDRHQQGVGPVNGGNGTRGFGPNVDDSNGPGFDFDGFSCFPTLESWKVM